MEGPTENPGIIPRIVSCIFESIDESSENIEFELRVSIMEIYKEEIKDLLDISNRNLKIRSEKPGGVAPLLIPSATWRTSLLRTSAVRKKLKKF